MSTTAQTKANRENAQKSTGPRTEEGKAVVSQNAVKHGLFAAEAVITGENPADYQAYHDQFLAELAPYGMIEIMLAERIVSLAWRLQRAERMQNQVIDDMIGREVTNNPARRHRECYYVNKGIRLNDPRVDLDDLPLGRIATSDWSNCRVLDRMMMYERRIENSVIKLMKELKRFQVIRRIEIQEVEKKLEPSPSLRDSLGGHSRKGRLTVLTAEAATRLGVKECDLKKQSQYTQPLIGVTPFVKGDYGNMSDCRVEENKANQSQLHARALSKRAGKRKKTLSTANALTG
jgi:hypothetical protein